MKINRYSANINEQICDLGEHEFYVKAGDIRIDVRNDIDNGIEGGKKLYDYLTIIASSSNKDAVKKAKEIIKNSLDKFMGKLSENDKLKMYDEFLVSDENKKKSEVVDENNFKEKNIISSFKRKVLGIFNF